MYEVKVWSIKLHTWQTAAKYRSHADAMACWRRLYNNGVNPRIEYVEAS